MAHKRRTNIYLDDDQLRSLRRLAAEGSRSMADVVREALDGFLGARGAEPPTPRPSQTAPPDLSSRSLPTRAHLAGASHSRGDGLRSATRRFPVDAREWDQRPYFIHDYDISWTDLVADLRGEDATRRAWALGRLLDGARWADIWRLVSVEAVSRDLPRLQLAQRDFWVDAIRAWAIPA